MMEVNRQTTIQREGRDPLSPQETTQKSTSPVKRHTRSLTLTPSVLWRLYLYPGLIEVVTLRTLASSSILLQNSP